MSDLAWVALIIIAYKLFVQPITMGMAEMKRKSGAGNGPAAAPRDAPRKEVKGDYVEYEEVKEDPKK